MNEQILRLASHDVIREFNEISAGGSEDQRFAAKIIQQGMLALRDSVNRPERLEILEARLGKINELLVERFQRAALTAP